MKVGQLPRAVMGLERRTRWAEGRRESGVQGKVEWGPGGNRAGDSSLWGSVQGGLETQELHEGRERKERLQNPTSGLSQMPSLI